MPKQTPTPSTPTPEAASPAPDLASVSIDANSLQELANKITELDTKIAAASGNDTQARKAFIEQVTAERADAVNELVNNIVTQLKEKDVQLLVGLVNRLQESVKTELEPVVNTWVDAEFPKTQDTSKVDVDALKTTRKEQLNLFRALREVLNTFKIPNDHIPEPKRSGGGRPAGSTNSSGGDAKSGLNKEKYRYLMDGKPRPRTQNSISSLCYYATEGIPAKLNPEDPKPRPRWSTAELKDFLKSQGVEFGTQDTWEVKLPNDKTIAARRMSDADYVEFGIDPNAPAEGTAAETSTVEEAPAA